MGQIPPTVWFVDTSVLCELLDVPGRASCPEETRCELRRRLEAGDRFVLPVTAVIETGNHIANVKTGDRRAAAERFVRLVRDAIDEATEATAIFGATWDETFLTRLCEGASTGEPFVDLAGSGRMGAGDVAILVEAEQLARRVHWPVKVWTLEAVLGAYGS